MLGYIIKENAERSKKRHANKCRNSLYQLIFGLHKKEIKSACALFGDASFTQSRDKVCSCHTEHNTTVYSVLRSLVNILRVRPIPASSVYKQVYRHKSQQKCVDQEDGNTSTSVIQLFSPYWLYSAGTSLNQGYCQRRPVQSLVKFDTFLKQVKSELSSHYSLEFSVFKSLV